MPATPATPPTGVTKFARQKRLVTLLGVLLILAGIVILVALRRLPPPLRIMAGLGDIFMGSLLLVVVAQAKSPANPARSERNSPGGDPQNSATP